MTSSAAHAREVERATIELLQQHMTLERVSARELDRRTGMSHHRISKILRHETNMTIADLATLCHGLDLDPARVLRTAEAMVSPIEVLAPQQEPSHMIMRLRRGQVPVAPIPAAPQLGET